MRYALTPDHREFFDKKGYIAFEEILSADQVARLKSCIENTLSARLHAPKANLQYISSAELFQAGYDLWRSDEGVKKIVQKTSLTTLASELFQTLPIRLGFDQYVQVCKGTKAPFSGPLSFQDMSSLSPLAGGLILSLSDLASPLSFFPLPMQAGSGLFIAPSFPIPWPEIFATPSLQFLLIAFAKSKTLFRADTQDVHAVELKKMGYVFNDRLKDSLHPILLRKN